MELEHIARLIESLTPVLWIGLVLFLILRFEPAMRSVIESARWRKFSLKIGGQELSMEEITDQQSKILADLQAQVEALRVQNQPGEMQAEEAVEANETEAFPRRKILWVDDNPKNNSFIVQMFRDRGIEVDIALSTQEAMRNFGSKRYGAIISDMGREEDGRFAQDAGIQLLKEVRRRDTQIPFIIFCSSRKSFEYREIAYQLGATNITSSTTDVTGSVLRIFGSLGNGNLQEKSQRKVEPGS